MTRDDALKLAAECGNDNGTTLKSDLDFLVAFAQRVAATEREECAKACDEYAANSSNPMNFAENCAAAIRARGGA